MAKSARDIRAGRAFVELFADDSNLVRGLKSAQSKLAAWGAAIRSTGLKMMGLGSAIAVPLLASAKASASAGAALYDMSQRTGMSAESLSRLGFAADMTGASMETAEVGIRRMQRVISASVNGNKAAAKSLSEIGLAASDLAGLSPEEQFGKISAAISNIEDPTMRAGAAIKIFGRSGTELLPLMSNLSSLQAASDNLGFTKSAADAKSAKEFSLVLQILAKSVKSLYNALGSAVGPTLKQWGKEIIAIVLSARDWVKAHKDVIVSALKVGVAVMAAGAALVTVGYAIIYLSRAVGILVSICGAVYTSMTVVGNVLAWLGAPAVGLITLIAAIGAIFIYASGAATAAIKAITDGMAGLVDDCKTAFGAIAKAISGGDITLAAEIFWNLLRLEWSKGIGALQSAWNAFWTAIKLTANNAWTGLLVGWENLINEMTKLLINARSLWDKAIATSKTALSAYAIGAKAVATEIAIRLNPTLSKEETAEQIKDVRREAVGQAVGAYDEMQAALKAADDLNATMLQGAADKHDMEMKNILAEGDARDAEYKKTAADNQAAIQADIDTARGRLVNSEATANALPAKWSGGGKGLDVEEWLAKAKLAIAGAGDMLAAQGGKDKVFGTFNASAAWGLSAGGAAERTARASEATARNTKDIVDALEDGIGPVYE
jgi:hypothetical protein